MRGICTIASLSIVGKTVKNGLNELFRIECDRCNGTGKLVCTTCSGTKTLARIPSQKLPNLQIFNRRHEDLMECFFCGPTTIYDNFGPLGEEEDFNEVDRIRDSLRNALHNKPTPRDSPLAGTICCPVCRGQRMLFN